MKNYLWAALLSAAFGFLGVNGARANITVNLDTTCSGGTCTTGGSLGTVVITQVSANEITYAFSLSKGVIWDSGITTAF